MKASKASQLTKKAIFDGIKNAAKIGESHLTLYRDGERVLTEEFIEELYKLGYSVYTAKIITTPYLWFFEKEEYSYARIYWHLS